MIQATAPGKIILFGEHAVVYARPAIAVPVTNVRATARLDPAPSQTGLKIVAPELNRNYLLNEAEPKDPLAAIIRLTLSYLGRTAPPDAALTITSTIPLGRGLGSGAAISTAIVRVLAQSVKRPLSPAEVSELVYEVEKLYHGTPSGIDNTVVAFEQPVYFVRQQPIQRIPVGRPLTFVVGDTGRVSPTHKAVGDLRRRWQADRAGYDAYFDQIGAIVDQARASIEHRTPESTLGRLMNENQEILQQLSLSSPDLDRLIEAARRAGALGAKLSGAGWGGNMIALAASQPESAAVVSEALKKAGAVGVIVTQVAPD